MKKNMNHWAYDLLLQSGLPTEWIAPVIIGLDLILLVVVAALSNGITRRVLLTTVRRIVKRTKAEWDDLIFDEGVFTTLAHIVPAGIVRYVAPEILFEFDGVVDLLIFIINLYIFWIVARVVIRMLNSMLRIFEANPRYRDKPIESYIQLGKIIVYIGSAIYVIALVIGTTPIAVLTTLGAATAVLLLVFRDPILGLVASITISANDTLRIGDWVSFDKFGADGDVIRINLTSVQIRNWDNTISTVPTYAFQSESFKNWRNMQKMGARRIMRAIHFKVNSVRFLGQEDLEKMKSIQRIREFIEAREREVNEWNKTHRADKNLAINGRNMTNIGLFLAYALAYLNENPNIHNELTIMVRQLDATEKGVPLQVYAFCNDTVWVNYERIQSDIFDHLISAAPFFDLELFEYPSGSRSARDVSSTPTTLIPPPGE